MPRLTYTPTGGSPKVWDIDFGRMLLVERMAIEKQTGLGWNAIQNRFWGNEAAIIHAFLWVLLKRGISTLRADQVDFFDDEITVDLTDAEMLEAKENIEARDVLDEEDVKMLAEIEKRFAGRDAESDADEAEGSDPKAD